MKTHLNILFGHAPLNRAAPENVGFPQPTRSFRDVSTVSGPGVGDCVTKDLLVKIEAQLPNVAGASFGLRAIRARLTQEILDANELRSRFPDSFLHGRVSVFLTEPCVRTETTAK